MITSTSADHFIVKFRNELWKRLELKFKTVTSPQICCCTTSWK